MCIAAAAVPAISLAVSAVSTGFGIYQGQQQAQYQAQQARRAQQNQNRQLQEQARRDQLANNQAIEQARYQRQAQINQHQGQVRAMEASYKSYNQQIVNNDMAANRKYRTEQLKMKEARDVQAFKTQENYAKMIGAQGKVLA